MLIVEGGTTKQSSGLTSPKRNKVPEAATLNALQVGDKVTFVSDRKGRKRANLDCQVHHEMLGWTFDDAAEIPSSGRSALFRFMTSAFANFRFEPLPNKFGTGWYLLAKHPNGQEEHINGFASAFEAVAWLGTSKHEDWLKARGARIDWLPTEAVPRR